MEAPSLYGPSDDKRPAIIGTSCTLLVIGNLCVAARCLTHLRSLNKIYVEDVFLLLAMVGLRCLLALSIGLSTILGLWRRCHW